MRSHRPVENRVLGRREIRIRLDLIIECPREQVWAAFDDPANMTKWQPTLESFEHVSGQPGQPGAVSRLVCQQSGRAVEMSERATDRRQSESLAGGYEAAGTVDTIECLFELLEAGRTRWRMKSKFSFRGLFKLLAPLMKGSLRRRTVEDLGRFKSLVEGGKGELYGSASHPGPMPS